MFRSENVAPKNSNNSNKSKKAGSGKKPAKKSTGTPRVFNDPGLFAQELASKAKEVLENVEAAKGTTNVQTGVACRVKLGTSDPSTYLAGNNNTMKADAEAVLNNRVADTSLDLPVKAGYARIFGIVNDQPAVIGYCLLCCTSNNLSCDDSAKHQRIDTAIAQIIVEMRRGATDVYELFG